MVQKSEVYFCSICGNVIEVLHPSSNNLVCCGQPMKLMDEKSEGDYADKHAPVIESIDGDARVRIKVGKVPHPMQENHYIEWIEIVTPDRVLRKFLRPGEKPEKEFTIRAGTFTARMFCNVHGLWKNQE